jgi:cell shape-determining protein MreC
VGGIYPRELVIGKVKEIRQEGNGLSLYAIIEPRPTFAA